MIFFFSCVHTAHINEILCEYGWKKEIKKFVCLHRFHNNNGNKDERCNNHCIFIVMNMKMTMNNKKFTKKIFHQDNQQQQCYCSSARYIQWNVTYTSPTTFRQSICMRLSLVVVVPIFTQCTTSSSVYKMPFTEPAQRTERGRSARSRV